MSNPDDSPSRLELLVRIVELERQIEILQSELEAVLKTKENFYYNHSFLQVSSDSEEDSIC